jgi:hypothetical protein
MRFFFFLFLLLLCSITFVWRRVCLYKSLMQLFLENDRTARKREREIRWFRLLRLCKQQSIDLLFIIDHYSLLCSVYLSLPHSFFFVNSACMHTHSYSLILVIAPCFANTSTHVQMKRMMTVVPLY